MKRLTPPTWQSLLWYALAPALGILTFFSLGYGMSLELWVFLIIGALLVLYMSGRSDYLIVWLVICASMLINSANYTFFSYTADGTRVIQGTEARLLTLLRLPMAAFAVGAVCLKSKDQFLRFLPKNWDVVIFCALPFLSAVFSLNRVEAIQYSLWLALSLLTILGFVFLLGRQIPSQQWSEKVAWLLFLSSFPVVALGLTALPSYQPGRMLVGAYSEANFYAYACAVVLAALLVLDRRRGAIAASKLLKKVPFLVLVGLGISTAIPLLLSAKRSPILAVAATLAVYAFAPKPPAAGRRFSSWIRPVLLVLVFAAIVWVVLPHAQTTVQRFEKVFDEPSGGRSLQGRQDVIHLSLSTVARANPIFGIGLANGSVAVGGGLHNTVLAILVEMGGVGLLFFLIMIVRSFHFFLSACSASLRWDIVLLSLPPIFLALTEYNLIPGQAMFWPLWIVLLLPRVGMVQVPAPRQDRPRPPRRVRMPRPMELGAVP